MKYSLERLTDILVAAERLKDKVQEGMEVEVIVAASMAMMDCEHQDDNHNDHWTELLETNPECIECGACRGALNDAHNQVDIAVDKLIEACLLANREWQTEQEAMDRTS